MMPEMYSEQQRTCIFCAEPFSLEEVRWLISESAGDLFPRVQGLRNPHPPRTLFEGTMDRFLRPDTEGLNFFSEIGSSYPYSKSTSRVRLVMPDDLKPVPLGGKKNQPNLFQALDGSMVPIFHRPNPRDPTYPGLKFTKEFVDEFNHQTGFNFGSLKANIEKFEIKPVCPHCTSYLPDMLLHQNNVVKLGFIGPSGSGKTTLNVVNLKFNCLSCGGWTVKTDGIYASSHHFADNYYEAILKSGKIPRSMPERDYIPPLLIKMERGTQQILLELIDVPEKNLKDLQRAVLNHKQTAQTIRYFELLKQLDGWLLILDAEQEILPKIGVAANPVGSPPEDTVNLESLIQLFSGIESSERKPASLLITKCDCLFDQNLTTNQRKRLFRDFSPAEQAVWQQRKEKGTYSADRQEVIQYSFKPLVQKLFPDLWPALGQYFSQFAVFPESSWGDILTDPDTEPEDVDISQMKPFYSAEPIIWLLDMIQ